MYLFLATNSLLYWLKKVYKEYKMCLMDIMIISSTWSHSDRVIPHFDMAPDLFTLYGRHHLQSSLVDVKQVGMLEACSIVCIFRGKPKNHKSHLLKLITNQRYISFIYQHWNQVFQDDFMLMNNRSRTQFTKEPMLIKICTST